MAHMLRQKNLMNMNSSANKIIQKETIPPCEEVVVECTNYMPLFLLSDIAYLSLPFVMNNYADGGKTFSVINCLVHTIENSFRRLKIRSKCLQCTTDINNTLPQVYILALHYTHIASKRRKNF